MVTIMADAQVDARHQTFSNLDLLWSSGNPQILPVSGTPWCEILLDPKATKVTLRTTYQQPEPDLAKLKNVSFVASVDGATELAEITVHSAENVRGAYGLVAAIADGLQLEGSTLAIAVADAVDRFKDVLAQRAGLSEEAEVGLYGELLFLEFLVGAIGPGAAVSSWLGPLSEEHDFVFGDVHLEVKTTSSERRRHMISGLDQLVPPPGVPLALVSIQLTRASNETGRTLARLLADVRTMTGGHVVELDRRLQHVGWRNEDLDLFPTAWVTRALPRAYAVDTAFPALTPALLGPVVSNLGLVSDVTYRVDLSGLDFIALPEPYNGFFDSKKA
jgi:hypothetical protein